MAPRSQSEARFQAALGNLDEDETTSGDTFGDQPSFAATINAANAQLSRGNNAAAAELYRKAIPLRDPRVDGSAYVGLGAALHSARQNSEAAEVLAAGAKLNPQSPGMLQNLAIVRSDLGQWKAAASAWKRALALRPNDAEAYRNAFQATKNAKGALAALPYLGHAAALDSLNWQHHYSHAHGYLEEAYKWLPKAAADPTIATTAFRALRPLHRLPISLRMRSEHGAEPPWTRDRGRGLKGDQPPPISLQKIWDAQAKKRIDSAKAGRQSGLIVYKLGPKASEVEHLKLSFALLMRHHNKAFRYPMLIAHDEPIDNDLRKYLTSLSDGVPLSFAKLTTALPSHMKARDVPERVLGFPVAYRHMIRWKVGLLWHMPEVQSYEYIWSLDTDAFLLGPLTYDVFGLMASRNASYGYIDVNVETPEVADGLSECINTFLKQAKPKLTPTMLSNFTSGYGARARWDGSKFYTNFQVARRSFGSSAGFTKLFEHIDHDGGIYRHRWGADPILFLGVTIFLQPEEVVHFDDVPYMHQHLVSNLPEEPMKEELALPKEFDEKVVVGAAVTAAGEATPVAAASAEDGGALLFVSDTAHVAAAVDALASYEPSPACGKPLALRVCFPDAVSSAETTAMNTLLGRLPPAHFAVGSPEQCSTIASEAVASGRAPSGTPISVVRRTRRR